MSRGAKDVALVLAAACGAFTLARYVTRRRFRIFAYHGVSSDIPAHLNFDGFFVHPDVFEQHLRTLTGHYHVMPLSELARRVQAGESMPDRAAAVTFDDGYLNNFTEAAPLLAKYDVPATFFVTTGFVDGTHVPWWFAVREKESAARAVDVEAGLKNLPSDKRSDALREFGMPDHASLRMMSWEQMRELAKQGHEIGAHTVSHISLGHETSVTIEKEVAESLERIRSQLGTVSPVYSYPYGEQAHFTDELGSMLKRHGCLAGVTTVEGMNAEGDDPFRWRRLNVTGNHDRNAFRSLASGLTHIIKK